MNKTIWKRITAFLTVVTIILSLYTPSLKAEAKHIFRGIYVYTEDEVENDKPQRLIVIDEGEDLLFSLEDLKFLTRYKYKVNKNEIYLERGSKRIIIDTKKNTLKIDSPYSGAIELRNKVVKYDGEYYLSGTSVFPWLNVYVAAKEGKLYVIRDRLSIWDHIKDFDENFDELECDYSDVLKRCGYGKKEKALAFLENKGLTGWIKDVLWIPGTDYSYGTMEDYYNAFSGMVTSTDPKLELYKDLASDSKRINALSKIMDQMDASAGYNDYEAVFAGAKGIGIGVNRTLEFYNICYSIANDITGKLDWLKSIWINRRATEYPQVIEDTAMSVYNAYENQYEAIFQRVVLDVGDWALGEMTSPETVLFKRIGQAISTYGAFDESGLSDTGNCAINYNIAKSVKSFYKATRAITPHSEAGLEITRGHGAIYLYFNAKNWEILAHYATMAGKKDVAEECLEKQRLCNNWLVFFTEAAASAENDCLSYKGENNKGNFSDELEDVFTSLKVEKIDDKELKEIKQNKKLKEDTKKNNTKGESQISDDFFAFFPDNTNNDSGTSRVYGGIHSIYYDSGDAIYYTFNDSYRPGTFRMYRDTLEEDVERIWDNGSCHYVNTNDGNVEFNLTLSSKVYLLEAYRPGSQDSFVITRDHRFNGAVIYGNTIFYVNEDGNLCKYTYKYGDEVWNGTNETILELSHEDELRDYRFIIARANASGTFVVEKTGYGRDSEYMLFDSKGKLVRESNEMEARAHSVRRDGSLAIVDVHKTKEGDISGYVNSKGEFTQDEWVRYITNDCTDYYIDLTYSDGDIYYVTRNDELYVRKSGSSEDKLIHTAEVTGGYILHPFDGVLFVAPGYVYLYNSMNSGAAYKVSLSEGEGIKSIEVTAKLFPSKYDDKKKVEALTEKETDDDWMNGKWVAKDDSNISITFEDTFMIEDTIYYKFLSVYNGDNKANGSFILENGDVKISTIDGYVTLDVYYNPYTEELTITSFDSNAGLPIGTTEYVRP